MDSAIYELRKEAFCLSWQHSCIFLTRNDGKRNAWFIPSFYKIFVLFYCHTPKRLKKQARKGGIKDILANLQAMKKRTLFFQG